MSHEEENVSIMIDGKPYPNITKNSLPEISLTAYLLGILCGITIALLPFTDFSNFNLYLVSLSVFHLLEFFITAKFNPGKVTTNSFLINNGIEYKAAHILAITEYIIEYTFFKNKKCWMTTKTTQLICSSGLLLIVVGQLTRTCAMSTAGKSFSHTVKTAKISDHELVTDGIYSIFRHPSYFGYFWWAIGTQLLLLNPISLTVFTLVLWQFFNKRIQFEEKYLAEFFGEKYLTYKKSVPVRIPFVN